jgi:hypothetical protein
MKLAPLPSSKLSGVSLPQTIVPAGTHFVRIHWPGKALFFGPGAQASARSRFDSVSGAFGTCYLADSTRGAFAETFLRAGRVRVVTETQLNEREWSVIEVLQDLSVVPLHGPALSLLGTTAAVASGAYSRSRAWSAALHAHRDAPDGVRYRSRHNDDELCMALFDRAQGKVRVAATLPLRDPATGVISAIDAYDVAVL